MTDMDTSYEDLLIQLSREMSRLKDDRSVGAVFDGKFSLKWPTRIQGPNGDPYIIIRQAGGVLSSVPAAEYSADQWVDGDYWDWLPIDTIWAYSGAESDIPQGWHLCDGTEGTHDLRGYFILGSSLDDAGVATDATSAVLDDHALQTHSGVSAQAHSSNTGTPSATTAVASGAGTTVPTSTHVHAESLSHTLTQPDDHAALAHTFSSESAPASFTLAFIQKVE